MIPTMTVRNMADAVDRRTVLKSGALAMAALHCTGIVAVPYPAAAAASAAAFPGPPCVTLHMGVPEIDTTGHAAPYVQDLCPGVHIRDHGDWWMP